MKDRQLNRGLLGVAVGAALAVGIVVALASSAVFELDTRAMIGLWGVVHGLAVTFLTLGLILALGGRRTTKRVGLGILAATLCLISLGVALYAIAFEVPLLSLEGLWMWPTVLVSALAGLGSLFWLYRSFKLSRAR